MSVFSNRYSGARQEAGAYIEAVLELLGDRDALEVLESTPTKVERATGDLTPEQLARPEAPGKWSILEVVRHLADNELVWGYRLRRVMAEDRPAIHGFDQDRWASELGYARTDLKESLEELRVLRRGNVRLLRQHPGSRTRVGVHSERGEESIEHMMRLYAGHDLAHLRQLERIRAGLGAGPKG